MCRCRQVNLLETFVMGCRASVVTPAPGYDKDTKATPPGPIDHAQLQHELHRQATQRKPKSTTVSSSSSSPPSQYSISKLQAFDGYHDSTSLAQGIAVLLVTPLPCLAVMLVLESLPLAHPSLGWQANYVFFVRMFIGMIAIASCTAFECREFIPETQLTWKQVAVIAICQAVAYVAMLVGLAVVTGVFPVPFSLVLGFAPAIGVGFYVQYLLTQSQIPLIPDFAARYRRLLAILTVEVLPVLVYPFYATLFMQLSSRDQVAFSLLLPLIKYALRSLLLWKLHAHADIAGAVSSSVHLFHVLFTLTCLQNAKTFATMGFFVAWNVANAVVSCLKTVYFARTNWELQRATVALESPRQARLGDEWHENVAKRALVLVEHTKVLSILFREDPSVLVSPYHRYSSLKWIAKHQELLLKQQSGRQRAPVRRANNKQSLAPLGGSQHARRVNSAIKLFLDAGPAQVMLSPHRLAIAPKVSSFLTASPVEIQDTLAILHANELCLLNSYISGMVYMLYGASLVATVC